MTPLPTPITFEPRTGGREVALLGRWEIGAVTPWPENKHRVRAFWSCALPPLCVRAHPVHSVAVAKRELLDFVADWLDGAGDSVRAEAVMQQAGDVKLGALERTVSYG